MKKYIFKSYLITIIISVILLGNSNLYAQENDFVEIHLKKAGKLSSELKKINNYANLRINGPLNGSDFIALNKYCSLDLKILDLSDARIMPGGKVLHKVKEPVITSKDGKIIHKVEKKIYKLEEEDVLCNYSLQSYKNLKVLILPKRLKRIEAYALTKSLNLSEIYFTNVTPTKQIASSIKWLVSNLRYKKIFVPGEGYKNYRQLVPDTYSSKLFKSDAPNEYSIHVSSNNRLLSELEGGFDFVKRLVVHGTLNDSDLMLIKELKNLEYLDLREAIIKDSQLEKILDTYVNELVPKTNELLDLENDYEVANRRKQVYINNLQNEINNIKSKKVDLEKRRKNVIEKQGELALMSLIFSLSEEEVKKQYRRGEINELEYYFGSQFYSEVQKELEELDISKDSDLADDNKYNKLQSYHDNLIKAFNDSIHKSKTIIDYNEVLETINVDLKPLLKEHNMQQNKMKEYLKNNSSIPTHFLDNPRLKEVVLPKNTAVIAESAFKGHPYNMKVIVDKNNLKIFNNIGISNWDNVLSPSL